MKTFLKISGPLALALALISLAIVGLGLAPGEVAVPRSYSCAVYTEQGCAKYVVASGGEIEVQSGGTVDLQSGSTASLDAAIDLNSTLNVDGATTLNSTLDVDGNISSGTGAITMTDNAVITGTLDVQGGDITLANDETIGNSTDGLIDLGGGLILNSTTITVTNGQTITPTTYTGYRLNAAGAVTITLAACSSDFQPLALYGEDNQTITIADSNIRTNDGNAQTLGQYDLITWMCINSEWIEVSDSNNS